MKIIENGEYLNTDMFGYPLIDLKNDSNEWKIYSYKNCCIEEYFQIQHHFQNDVYMTVEQLKDYCIKIKCGCFVLHHTTGNVYFRNATREQCLADIKLFHENDYEYETYISPSFY
tara:strand:+ start:96 stop:440 length:345 start_codon:yes stop_codon:yes gene_type:complete